MPVVILSSYSCEELNNNFRELAKRENHTGTQSASTIFDLADAVTSLTEFVTLSQDLVLLTSRVTSVENQLSGGDLQVLIDSLNAQINALLSGLDDALTTSAAFISLQTDVTTNAANIVTAQDDINQLDLEVQNLSNALALKANLESPALTGTPTTPTPLPGSNNTNIANTEWVRNLIAEAIFRPGMIIPSASDAVPMGWLFCDGREVSRVVYADLFAAIGTVWGAGDGSTTFNLPNFMGRSLIGRGTPTGQVARSLGQLGGNQETVLTVANLASHNHPSTVSEHNHSGTIAPHTHGVQDGGHRHTIDAFDDANPNVGSSGLDFADTAQDFRTATSNSSQSNISILPGGEANFTTSLSRSNVDVLDSGSNVPFSNESPYAVITWLIRF